MYFKRINKLEMMDYKARKTVLRIKAVLIALVPATLLSVPSLPTHSESAEKLYL